nr:SMI1/KNR4 family protein [Mucilaginibacter sp. L294]
MEELENLLAKLGFVEKAGVKNNFRAIESLIGFNLPDDYRYYLNNYESFEGDIGDQYIVLYSPDELLAYNKACHADDQLSYTVLIGSNGASENIGIRAIDQNNYRLVTAQYIHHVDDQVEIGLSFTDMLKRLNSGIAWFS